MVMESLRIGRFGGVMLQILDGVRGEPPRDTQNSPTLLLPRLWNWYTPPASCYLSVIGQKCPQALFRSCPKTVGGCRDLANLCEAGLHFSEVAQAVLAQDTHC